MIIGKSLKPLKAVSKSIKSMKEAMKEMADGVELINTAGNDLHSLSGIVNDAIIDIGVQVDKFKI